MQRYPGRHRGSGWGGGAGVWRVLPDRIVRGVVGVGFYRAAAEQEVGDDGVVDLDGELFADREEEFGGVAELFGIGGEVFVEQFGGFAAERAAVWGVGGLVAEGFEQGDAAGVGAECRGDVAADPGGAGGEAGFEGDQLADRGGEADEGGDRVGGFSGGGAGGAGGGAA